MKRYSVHRVSARECILYVHVDCALGIADSQCIYRRPIKRYEINSEGKRVEIPLTYFGEDMTTLIRRKAKNALQRERGRR